MHNVINQRDRKNDSSKRMHEDEFGFQQEGSV